MKKKEFKLTSQVIFRLIIFTIIIIIAFNYLGQGKSPSILGDYTLKPYSDWAYHQLPPQSQSILENFSTQPLIIDINQKIDQIKNQLKDFPDTQIKEIKKQIIKNVSDKLIESIDKPKTP